MKNFGLSNALISLFCGVAMVVVVIGAGCASNVPPDTSPEGKAAIHATRVVEGLRAVLPALKPLVCLPNGPTTGCVAPADALRVVQVVEGAADVVVDRLGPLLRAVDAATTVDDKVTGMARVRAVLAEIQTMLMNVSVAPDNEPARQQLVQLFANVTALLFAVQ